MNKENKTKYSIYHITFDHKLKHFCQTLDNSLEAFILQDPGVLNYYKNSFDCIFHFLTFNYECTCTNKPVPDTIETIVYDLSPKNKFKVTVNVRVLGCHELQFEIIDKVIKLVSYFNPEFRFYFTPCLKRLSQNARMFNRDCKYLNKFVSIFCKIFDSFIVKERNDNFMNRTFVDLVIDNCAIYEMQDLFFACITKNSFIVYLNQIDIIDKLNRLVTMDNLNALHILKYLIEKRSDKMKYLIKYGWNHARYLETICTYESEYFNLFLKQENEYDSIVVYNFLCKILEIEGDHSKFLVSFDQFIRVYDFNAGTKTIGLKFLHVTRLLSYALKHSGFELNAILEQKRVFNHLFEMFFANEESTHFHQSILICVRTIFAKNLADNFRFIIILINLFGSKVSEWAREFFARENEPNGVLPSLHAYCLELFRELKKMLKLGTDSKEPRIAQICYTIERLSQSAEFTSIRWYVKKCMRIESIVLEENENVEAFLEDCASETHIRYIYYTAMQNFPYNKLFDML